MMLIDGMNILVGKNGVTSITQYSCSLAEQFNLSVKLIIYRYDNRLKNINDVLEIFKNYSINVSDVEFSGNFYKTQSILLCNNQKYDVKNDGLYIIDVCNDKKNFSGKNKVYK